MVRFATRHQIPFKRQMKASPCMDTGSGAVAKSSAEMKETLARSHDFCWCELGPEGCGSLQHLDH